MNTYQRNYTQSFDPGDELILVKSGHFLSTFYMPVSNNMFITSQFLFCILFVALSFTRK